MADEKEKEARITHIVHKGRALERSLGSLKTYLEGESPEFENAECRLKSIKALFEGYVTNHEELITLQPGHSRVAAYAQIESDYYALSSRVRKMKTPAPAPLANSTTLNSANLTLTERHDVPKLPYIDIPKFNGEHGNWARWKSSFESLVHNRADINGLVKHSHLTTAVKDGSAAVVISEFTESEVEYPLAWQALCSAYDQTRITITEHLDALFELPKVEESKPELLANLMYKTRQRIVLLNALSVKLPDAAVVRLLERALPPKVYARWVGTLKGDKIPKVEELYDFIQETINVIRQMKKMPQGSRKAPKRPADSALSAQSKGFKSSTRSFVTTTSTDGKKCQKCGQAHWLYRCPAFKQLNLKEKYRIVDNNNMCSNCLRVHATACTSIKHCQVSGCKEPHHSLLHPHKKSKGPDAPAKAGP